MQLVCLNNQLHRLNKKYCSVQDMLLHLDPITVLLKNLKLESYDVQHYLTYARIFKVDLIHSVPFIEIYVQESLDYNIRVYSWDIPASHHIYENSLKDLTLSSLK